MEVLFQHFITGIQTATSLQSQESNKEPHKYDANVWITYLLGKNYICYEAMC